MYKSRLEHLVKYGTISAKQHILLNAQGVQRPRSKNCVKQSGRSIKDNQCQSANAKYNENGSGASDRSQYDRRRRDEESTKTSTDIHRHTADLGE